jgi:hypothetical protein
LSRCIEVSFPGLRAQPAPFKANTALTTAATTATTSNSSGRDSPNSSRGWATTLAERGSLRRGATLVVMASFSFFHAFSECLFRPISVGIPGFTAGIMLIFSAPDKRSFCMVLMNFLHA